jgi:hypothetical protein
MLRERIRSMEFQRSISSRLRSGSRTSPTRANLVIKDMTPTGDESAMLVMMQEEGVRRLNHASSASTSQELIRSRPHLGRRSLPPSSRSMTTVLTAAALRRDLALEARIGPAGIALLPQRSPPQGPALPSDARQGPQGAGMLSVCRTTASRRPATYPHQGTRGHVRHRERAGRTSLRSASERTGVSIAPSHLSGVRQVDAVITPEQTSLERVREIGAALSVQINAQQQAHLQRAVRLLEKPIFPPGHAHGQEQLATQFLQNSAGKNHTDPRVFPRRRSWMPPCRPAAIGGERVHGQYGVDVSACRGSDQNWRELTSEIGRAATAARGKQQRTPVDQSR